MSLYESVIIIRQETSAQQVEALGDTYADVISKNGGSIKKRENWGLRSLAYKIKKNRKGHYILFNIDAPSTAVQEMERLMSLNEDVLRYLTLKVDELDENPSIPAQNLARNERSSNNYNNDTTEKKPDATEPDTLGHKKTEVEVNKEVVTVAEKTSKGED